MTLSTRPSWPAGRPGRDAFHYLQRLMRQRLGVVLEPGKEYLAETRLAALAHREGFGSVGALLDSLRTEEACGALHRQVVEAMAITETSFFRDVHPFEALRESVIPALVARRREERTLHLWSAACASGQEPYSLAMLVRENFPELAGWTVRIVASDASQGMLERAREGVFSQIELNRGLPARYLVRCFDKIGREWRVRDEIRRMVEFRDINLIGPWPALPPMDVVLMRNVLLYFGPETRRSVLSGVARLLRGDGVLFLGGGESTFTLDGSFEPVQLGKAVGYRVASRASSSLRRAA